MLQELDICEFSSAIKFCSDKLVLPFASSLGWHFRTFCGGFVRTEDL